MDLAYFLQTTNLNMLFFNLFCNNRLLITPNDIGWPPQCGMPDKRNDSVQNSLTGERVAEKKSTYWDSQERYARIYAPFISY